MHQYIYGNLYGVQHVKLSTVTFSIFVFLPPDLCRLLVHGRDVETSIVVHFVTNISI